MKNTTKQWPFTGILFLCLTLLQPLRATGPTAYVCDIQASTLSVIDISSPPSQPTPAPTIALDSNPNWIAITPDGSTACVSHPSTKTVSIVDLTTQQHTIVNVGATPSFLAITPDGSKACVSNVTGHSISIIDLSTHATTTVEVGTIPLGIAITPDSSQACVCNDGDGTVSIVDLASQVVQTVVVDPSNAYIAITPDGTEAYVSCLSTGLNIINLSTHAVTKIPIPGGSSALAISPDGTRACVCGSLQGFYIIDTATHAVTDVSARGCALAITPDGLNAIVCAQFPGSISTINLSTHDVHTITIGLSNQTVAITPDGTKACICDSQGTTVYILDIAEQTLTPVTVGSFPYGIAITTPYTPPTNPLRPDKFSGKIKTHGHKKAILKMKWSSSTSTDVVQYEIFAFSKKIATISATAKRTFSKKLHSVYPYREHIPSKYFRYLHKKYKVRAISSFGLASPFKSLSVKD